MTPQPGIAEPQPPHVALVGTDGPLEELWERARQPGVTVTVALGPGCFAERPPVALAPLPAFPGDALEPLAGNVLVQVCGREREAVDAAAAAFDPLWVQRGHLDEGPHQGSPRNPLGFRDGTLTLRRPQDLERHVWVRRGDRTWMIGGTYLVYRRIRLDVAAFARLPEERQEAVIGRHKRSGAPLGERFEFSSRWLESPLLARDSHVFLAAPGTNRVAPMLRRGYSFDNGPDDRGILFLAFMRDPRRQFVPVQRRLAAADALHPFQTATASGVYAVPPLGASATTGMTRSPARRW